MMRSSFEARPSGEAPRGGAGRPHGIGDAVLSTDRVGKRYGGTTAVADVSLALAPGEFVALLGASGCGKSTTLRILAGLERPDTGRVTMAGADVTDRSVAERNVALMFQSYALYPHLTVAQNIAMPLRMRRLSIAGRLPGAGLVPGVARVRGGIATEVSRVAAMLQLDGLLDRRPGTLSGGQQQRVALARALVRDPVAFLLDEPMSNLDTALRAETRAEIRALHARTGHAFLIVTHDQADALSMADRVAVMIAGRIAQTDTPHEIYRRPASRAVAAFIGAHRMNLLAPGAAAQALHPAGASHEIGVRPEHLALDAGGPLGARMTAVAFHGDETVLSLVAQCGTPLTAALRGAPPLPPPGGAMRLAAAPGSLHAFDAATGVRVEVSA